MRIDTCAFLYTHSIYESAEAKIPFTWPCLLLHTDAGQGAVNRYEEAKLTNNSISIFLHSTGAGMSSRSELSVFKLTKLI